MQLSAYLTFAGNCREAMQFYRNCFGGTLEFETVGESPVCENLPLQAKDFVLHASLTNADISIMGSDMPPDEGLRKGNSVSLLVHCKNAADLKKYFKKISEKAVSKINPAPTHCGNLLGSVTDQYGTSWIFHCRG